MHTFAKKSFELFKKTYLSKYDNPKIVDVGSLDINGSIRDQINFKSEYIGVDLAEGKNVDKVLENPYKLPFDDNSTDIIVSISVFEHVEFFWETFLEMLRILKPNGKILFIEDLGEYLYHIDRMLYSLKRAGYFNNLKGIIVGDFTDLRKNTTPFGRNLNELILEIVSDYNIPVAFDFPAGHGEENFPMIFGREIEFSVKKEGSSIIFSD